MSNYSEEKQIAIQNLERYIKEDPIYNGRRENLSDFEEFCIDHCLDIQIALELIKEQQKEIERLKEIDIRKGKHTKENNTMEYRKMNSANKTGVTRCLYR